MKTTRKKAKFLKQSIARWETDGVIDQNIGQRLTDSIEVITIDWKRIAKYSFWFAALCLIISILSFFTDYRLLLAIASLFKAPELAKSIFFSILSVGIFHLGIKRKKSRPERVYSNGAIFLIGVFLVSTAIGYFLSWLNLGSNHTLILLFITSLIYAAIAIFSTSKLVWVFSLFSLGIWMGAQTAYLSGQGTYFLGMNYPLRFVLFGGLLLVASHFMHRLKQVSIFTHSTKVFGCIYLFISLWLLSIFGNQLDLDTWRRISQIELFHWSLLFGMISIGAIYLGVKWDDRAYRGFGITFLVINFYTRFFEFFWNALHKGLFFFILALSFGLIGYKAEKIWNWDMGFSNKEKKIDQPS